jgi:LPXTG-motif cell wall-anchored protein
MRENPNGLDERQREKRNRIGNQCFMLLLYALLLNVGLYGAGIKWFPYPADVIVIVTVVAFIYLARIIAGNAYLPPRSGKTLGRIKVIFLIVFSALTAAAGFLMGAGPSLGALPQTGDNTGYMLLMISAVTLVIALVMGLVQRLRNKEQEGKEE